MPSSSTNYSYDIPTVGSDSTTYGTIINQFVESLSTKLKTVSDKINAAGVGASSTLAQVNRNIAQVDAINSRIPVGVANLLPDPYSGATTPVSTWPYLNTELTAEGFSPPTTAQEVLDFDYSGFATYLNARLDSLSARITGLDAPISIQDTDQLVCEANTILDTIGEYKTVTTTTISTVNASASYFSLNASLAGYPGTTSSAVYQNTITYNQNNDTLALKLYNEEGLGTVTLDDGSGGNRGAIESVTVTLRAMDVDSAISNNDLIDPGIYINTTAKNKFITLRFFRVYNYTVDGDSSPWFLILGDDYTTWNPVGVSYVPLNFVKVSRTTGTVTTSVQVKKTIDDVDLSGCS
jgi:hypothetical protein